MKKKASLRILAAGGPRVQAALEKTPAHCNLCGEDIEVLLLVNVPLDVAAAYMRALRCPSCGADSKQLHFRLVRAAKAKR